MIKPRVAPFLTGFLVWVLFPAFLAAAELPAYKKYEGPIKPGVVITKENWDKYLPELQKLLPPAKVKWYAMGVKEGLVTMPIVTAPYISITEGQAEATRKYAGTARVGANNQLYDWVAGYPFPEPKNALEIYWNASTTIGRGSAHDDNQFRAWFGMFKNTKYEKHFVWFTSLRKYRGRMDTPPLGDMPLFTEGGIAFRSSLAIIEPDEVKGFINLRTRYWDIDKPDESYAYIPAIRRVRRLIGADNTDPLLGSDYINDDGEVWRQKLDSRMKFMVLEHRDFLVPKTYVGLEKKPTYDYKKNGPCFQVEWQIRPQWVLEVMINDPNYAYSKRILYIDAVPLNQGGSSTLCWGENYDQKGRLWRASGQGALAATKLGFRGVIAWININYQTDHYTLMDCIPGWKTDKSIPIDEDKYLNIKGLLRSVR